MGDSYPCMFLFRTMFFSFLSTISIFSMLSISHSNMVILLHSSILTFPTHLSLHHIQHKRGTLSHVAPVPSTFSAQRKLPVPVPSSTGLVDGNRLTPALILQNHRIAWVENDFKDHLVPTSHRWDTSGYLAYTELYSPHSSEPLRGSSLLFIYPEPIKLWPRGQQCQPDLPTKKRADSNTAWCLSQKANVIITDINIRFEPDYLQNENNLLLPHCSSSWG